MQNVYFFICIKSFQTVLQGRKEKLIITELCDRNLLEAFLLYFNTAGSFPHRKISFPAISYKCTSTFDGHVDLALLLKVEQPPLFFCRVCCAPL